MQKSPKQVRRPSKFTLPIWWQILKRTIAHVKQDNLPLIAAGVAFYFLLAVFPLIGAIVSLYGLLVTPDELQVHMTYLIGILPTDGRYIVEEQIGNVIQQSDASLGTGFLVSFALAVWSGGQGSSALITACNITYSEPDSRSFLHALLLRIVTSLAIVLVVIVALLLITILPRWLSLIVGQELNETTANLIIWPLLFVFFNVCVAALYRYGPHRSIAKWRWVTPGSLLATSVWVLGSVGFSLYLDNFAKYSEVYGSVGGIIVLLMWFFVSAFIILLGAEFNSAMELQTRADSTSGVEKPMGERGAFVADNLPKSVTKKSKSSPSGPTPPPD